MENKIKMGRKIVGWKVRQKDREKRKKIERDRNYTRKKPEVKTGETIVELEIKVGRQIIGQKVRQIQRWREKTHLGDKERMREIYVIKESHG